MCSFQQAVRLQDKTSSEKEQLFAMFLPYMSFRPTISDGRRTRHHTETLPGSCLRRSLGVEVARSAERGGAHDLLMGLALGTAAH